MKKSITKVLLADDHTLVRAGLKRVLEEMPDICIVAEAATGVEAFIKYEEVQPDVAIIDISMPTMDGLETIKKLITSYHDAKILVLTMYPEEHYVARVLKAGALGYITKGTSTSELHDAVRSVASGRRYLSKKGNETIILEFLETRRGLNSIQALSDRELQVLILLAKGNKTKEIALDLNLSIKTIETYRSRVLTKLSLHTTADITRFAYQNKLI